MTPFEKIITILDAKRKKYTLNIEITPQKLSQWNKKREWPLQFSMCDDNWQWCYRIEPATPAQSTIKSIREALHLKKVTQKQYDFIIETTKTLEEESRAIPITPEDYERLSELYTDRQIAIASMLELTEEELEKDIDQWDADKIEITVQWRDYYFWTDDEMDDVRIESIENAMDDYLPEAMVKYGRSNVTIEDWVVTASLTMNFEDRANELNRYDGAELSEEVWWVIYYMYRQ